MVDILTGKGAKDAQKLQQDAILSQQRQSLARMTQEQGVLDQQEVGNGFRRGRGKQLLAFLNTAGQSTIG